MVLQECEYMNALIYEMVRGLKELQLGFKGELTMSEVMEDLAYDLPNARLCQRTGPPYLMLCQR